MSPDSPSRAGSATVGALFASRQSVYRFMLIVALLCAGCLAPGAEPAIPAPNLSGPRPGTNHWAFHAIRKPVPPTVRNPRWLRNPIDAFVLDRLESAHLAPAPEADRTTMIRRLTFDLWGLPPIPADVDRFLKDHLPDAHERLVDRLLASPHYGERWGRHWLDVVRYTESQGFEYDHMRDNAWHYRDYVIRSFNEDKPYDRFLKEQVAGDILAPVTSDGIVGTSLLVCGAYDQAGNSQANATQRMITREEEMEDMISVVGQSFLGLTLNCARCHAHKFDPIPQEEYYRVKSVFDGVRHGERSIAPGTNALPGVKPAVSYVGTRQQPPPTHRLKRGDVNMPEEIVTPGALSAVTSLSPDFGLAADAPEGQRRLRFAEWLADERNPLPARVIVNRLWQSHFGQGLVTTPNDFGSSGAKPTHPELLDWLSVALVSHGWSLKSVHRLMVNSATYRQSSAFNPKAAARDAENQLLWRYTPHRLEAEALRDAVLVVSGQMNWAAGGPSFRPFDTKSYGATFYVLKDKEGPEFNRRTVYRMNINSGKDPMLDAFDCPDPSIKTPRRGVTTTPLQALSLMNNSFIQRQAHDFSARVLAEANGNLNDAIALAHRHAYGRAATASEVKRARVVARNSSLENVCWALLNATEFVYVQ